MEQTVGRFASRTEAEIVRRLLDDAGIPARLRADDVGAMHPELGAVGERHGITLVVPAEYVDEAQAFLASSETQPDPEGWEEPDRSRRSLRTVAVVLLVLAVGLALGIELVDSVRGFGR